MATKTSPQDAELQKAEDIRKIREVTAGIPAAGANEEERERAITARALSIYENPQARAQFVAQYDKKHAQQQDVPQEQTQVPPSDLAQRIARAQAAALAEADRMMYRRPAPQQEDPYNAPPVAPVSISREEGIPIIADKMRAQMMGSISEQERVEREHQLDAMVKRTNPRSQGYFNDMAATMYDNPTTRNMMLGNEQQQTAAVQSEVHNQLLNASDRMRDVASRSGPPDSIQARVLNNIAGMLDGSNPGMQPMPDSLPPQPPAPDYSNSGLSKRQLGRASTYLEPPPPPVAVIPPEVAAAVTGLSIAGLIAAGRHGHGRAEVGVQLGIPGTNIEINLGERLGGGGHETPHHGGHGLPEIPMHTPHGPRRR